MTRRLDLQQSQTIRDFAATIADLQARLERVERTSSLSNSSVDGGSLDVYDDSENLVIIIGEQYDGTYAAIPVLGPPPPTPSAPILRPVQGGLMAQWDGLWVDADSPPMDFSRVEVHAKRVDLGPMSGLLGETLRTTIESPRGGEVFIALPPLPHSVGFVARTLSGASGNPSAQTVETPYGQVSQEELDAINDAVQNATNGMEIALSGHRVFWSDEPPSPTPPLTATSTAVWFDTNDGNKPYDWSGTGWTPRPFGTGALAPGSVTYAQVSDGGITAAWFAAGSIAARIIGADIILGEHIEAAEILAGHIAAGQITADKLAANFILGSLISTGHLDENGNIVGQRVDIGPDGIRLIDVDGGEIVTLPIDGDQIARFRGGGEFTELRVLGGTSIESMNNRIAKDSALELEIGVTPPVQAPAMSYVYESVRFDTTTRVSPSGAQDPTSLGSFAFDPNAVDAFCYSPLRGGEWLAATRRSNGVRVWHFNLDGSLKTATFNSSVGPEPVVEDRTAFTRITGLTVRPNAGYYSYMAVRPSGNWVVFGQPTDTAPGVFGTFAPDVTMSQPTLGYDVANQRYLIAESLPGDVARIRRAAINAAGDQPLVFGTTWLGGASTGLRGGFQAVYYGTFDIGGTAQFMLKGRDYGTFNFAPGTNGSTYIGSPYNFPAAATAAGVAWDGIRFHTLGTNGYLYQHTDWTWTDTNARLFAFATYFDTDPAGTGNHETGAGPIAAIARRKRADLRVTMPAVPDKGGVDDPNAWRLYTAVSPSAQPATSAFRLQATGVPTSPTARSVLNIGGLVPGTALVTVPFPGSGSGRIHSTQTNSTGRVVDVRGDGSVRLGGFRVGVGGAVGMDRARVFLAADTAIPNDTWTNLTLTSVMHDTNAHVSTSGGFTRITVKKAGFYAVYGRLRFVTTGAGWRGMSIKRTASDGTAEGDVDVVYGPGVVGANSTLNGYAELSLNAGDYIYLQANQTSGDALTLQGGITSYCVLGLRAIDLL